MHGKGLASLEFHVLVIFCRPVHEYTTILATGLLVTRSPSPRALLPQLLGNNGLVQRGTSKHNCSCTGVAGEQESREYICPFLG